MEEVKIVVTRDGEVTKEYEPSVIQKSIDKAIKHVKLNTRMWALDMRYHTNYRKIRKQLLLEKRREQYAASIGLIPN